MPLHLLAPIQKCMWTRLTLYELPLLKLHCMFPVLIACLSCTNCLLDVCTTDSAGMLVHCMFFLQCSVMSHKVTHVSSEAHSRVKARPSSLDCYGPSASTVQCGCALCMYVKFVARHGHRVLFPFAGPTGKSEPSYSGLTSAFAFRVPRWALTVTCALH